MTAVEFNSSFNKMATLLQSFAYNLTKNMEDAKDLFQETAYRAITNRDKFRDGTNFKAWLFTIMKNIFINNYRKKVKSNIKIVIVHYILYYEKQNLDWFGFNSLQNLQKQHLFHRFYPNYHNGH